MAVQGLDYAGGRPGGAAIAATGYQFVCRYLTEGGPGLPGKLLTVVELADLTAHGIAVVLNWETTATRMLAGHAAGVADARSAAAVVAALGISDSRPIYFSADFDAAPGQQSVINDYLDGVASVIGRVRTGVYGSYYVCQRALDANAAQWAWQSAAWSGGQQLDGAHLYQHAEQVTVGGVSCDVNQALVLPDFGQHPYAATRDGDLVPWRLGETPQGKTTQPDGSWLAVEDTITLPGPAGGWHGRELAHVTFGNGGGFVQEAWWMPAGTHAVSPNKPAYFGQFETQHWEAPNGSDGLVLRYAAAAGGSVGIETEH